MVKKRLIDVSVVAIESKLEGNGALRNVAVNDAWKRLRQNIDVKSWKEAERVLQELSTNLQKINMFKAMTASFSKLKQTFQNPEQMVEESESTPINTPREGPSTNKAPKEDKPQAKDNSGESKHEEELSGLKLAIQSLRESLETGNLDSNEFKTPNNVSSDTQICYKGLDFIKDVFKQTKRDLVNKTKQLENSESTNKDLEKQLEEKQEQIDKLTGTVNDLEKKHQMIKEEKIGNFKEQMKQKSLERQVEQKTIELTKVRDEVKELKERLAAITTEKTSNTNDVLNPFTTERLVEKYVEIYKKERNDALTYYKTERKMSEAEAARRVLDILLDSYKYCADTSITHLQNMAATLLSPGYSVTTSQGLSKLDGSELNQIQTLRKQTCKASSESAKNLFISNLEEKAEEKYSLQEITDNMEFIEKCVEICWFFAVQTPPLFINCGDVEACKVDDSKFEISFGKSAKVSFVKWPPLYAWRDGKVLRKGFVE